jgi:basic amino acid/polyamine antiporter, APA family
VNAHPESAAPAPGEPPQLVRVLGLGSTSSIVVGIMIGTAIFLVPSDMLRQVGSPFTSLGVWVVAGVLSLFGALSFAELAGIMPQAGGQYVYLREAYGPLVSFLCGWQFLIASQTAGISVLAVGFAEYANEFVPLTLWEQRGAAAAAIVVFTAINYLGVREGGEVQSLLTGVKVAAIVAIILLGYALARGPVATPLTGASAGGGGGMAAFGAAMVGALWAYEGWNACTFASGEVKRPERNVPLALILGTGAVLVLYIGLNLFYYRVLTPAEITHSTRVGADAAVRVFGHFGAQLVSLLIIISTLSSLNGSILAAPRVYYAMAKDGLFFRWCAAVHRRYHTPHMALVLQGAWAAVLVLMGTYEQLYTYVVFAAWIFYALTGLAVLVLRRKMPNLPRPYRVWGYPWVPIAFVVTSGWFTLNMLLQTPREAGIGAVMLALGVPVYWIWKRGKKQTAH